MKKGGRGKGRGREEGENGDPVRAYLSNCTGKCFMHTDDLNTECKCYGKKGEEEWGVWQRRGGRGLGERRMVSEGGRGREKMAILSGPILATARASVSHTPKT